jgi:hypothetical protein
MRAVRTVEIEYIIPSILEATLHPKFEVNTKIGKDIKKRKPGQGGAVMKI